MESLELILVVIVLIPIFAFAIGIERRSRLKNVANATIRQVNGLSDFHPDFIRVTIEDQGGLAIDESRCLLMLIKESGRKVVRFDQIVSCEIKEDNASLIATRRGVGGVVIGGLLAGGVGAIVGGMASPQHSTVTSGVRRITLLVVIDDLRDPNHAVTFLFGVGGTIVSKSSPSYRNGLANAQLWHSRITVAMRRAEEAKSFAGLPSISAQFSGSSAIPSLTTVTAPTAARAQQPPSNLVGQRYTVLKQIGGGAMKKVYLAEDSRLAGRQCAVAEMLDNYPNPEEQQHATLAFQRECDLLATLDSQHIPKIYDHFSQDHKHYLVMEYVEGLTLEEMLSSTGGSLGENALIDLTRQILDTLSYLHGLRPPVIYRDLKPSNIMITRDGRIKLVDFGIARNFEPSRTATMIGTQGYAAPEQYSGRAEPRSDIYGLGAVMHHAITGRDPTSEAPFSFPPVVHLRPDVRPALGAVIDQALSYAPENRPKSADEMKVRVANLAVEIDSMNALRTVSAPLISVEPPPKANLTARISNFCPICGAKIVRGDGTCTNCGTRPEDAEAMLADEASPPTKGYNVSANKLLASHSKGERRSYSAFRLVVLMVVGGGLLAFFLVWMLMTPAPDRPGGVTTSDAPALNISTEPHAMSESDKAAAEDLLLEEVRSTPASDREANLKLYQRLAALRPDKQLYKQKVDHYARLVRKSHGVPITDPYP
jgi:serine/threonine protein kinase